MSYRVEYGRTAEKQMTRIVRSDRRTAQRIAVAIDGLAMNPRPVGCIELTGHPGLFRIRIGNWRVVYTVDDGVLVVRIVTVVHRGEVYRRL